MASGAMKLDAGKTPVMRGLFQYFPRALKKVAGVSDYGFQKYGEWGGWKSVSDALNRYNDAFGRHVLDEAVDGRLDPESGHLHAAHLAWNALARLELMLIEQEGKAQKER